MKQSVFGEYEKFTVVDLTRTHLGIHRAPQENTANNIKSSLFRRVFGPNQTNLDPKSTSQRSWNGKNSSHATVLLEVHRHEIQILFQIRHTGLNIRTFSNIVNMTRKGKSLKNRLTQNLYLQYSMSRFHNRSMTT